VSKAIPGGLQQFYLVHGDSVVNGPWKVKGAATAARTRIQKAKARWERVGRAHDHFHPNVDEYEIVCAHYDLLNVARV
jgi:hypothetical protein